MKPLFWDGLALLIVGLASLVASWTTGKIDVREEIA